MVGIGGRDKHIHLLYMKIIVLSIPYLLSSNTVFMASANGCTTTENTEEAEYTQ